jgi:hypothetical protein
LDFRMGKPTFDNLNIEVIREGGFGIPVVIMKVSATEYIGG